MRKMFIKEWDLLSGINFDTKSKGHINAPFDICEFEISLKHLEITCLLISPEDSDQLNIGNLTKDMVRNCDSIV